MISVASVIKSVMAWSVYTNISDIFANKYPDDGFRLILSYKDARKTTQPMKFSSCRLMQSTLKALISSVAWSTLFRLTFPVQSDQAIRSKYGTAHLNTTPNCPVVRLHNFWDMAGCWTKSVN